MEVDASIPAPSVDGVVARDRIKLPARQHLDVRDAFGAQDRGDRLRAPPRQLQVVRDAARRARVADDAEVHRRLELVAQEARELPQQGDVERLRLSAVVAEIEQAERGRRGLHRRAPGRGDRQAILFGLRQRRLVARRLALDRAHAAGLLYGVGELVREQAAAGEGVRPVLAEAEHDVRADREGARVDRGRDAARIGARIDPHGVELVAEARFHEAPLLRRQGLAAAAEGTHTAFERAVDVAGIRAARHAPLHDDVADEQIANRLRLRGGCLPLHVLAFLFALLAEALDLDRRTLDRRSGLRHPHHAISHAVRFLFVRVVGLTDGQLGLDGWRRSGR